ncbi:MAG: DUF1673 family protein [Methanosarcinaceae archaeon]|nr:DUF1673 family protein [Methanosarcinaceae archaeon]
MILKHIKKFLGWCPNLKASDACSGAIKEPNFEHFEIKNRDRGGSKSRTLKNPGWFRRLSNQFLLFAIFLTLLFFLIYIQVGLNLFVLFGFFPALVYFLFQGKDRIQRFNSIAKKPLVRHVPRSSYFRGLIIIIIFLLFMLLFYVLFGNQSILMSFSIILFYTWGGYFQLIYWERQNQMKIYLTRKNYIEKTYAIGEKE